MSDVGDLGDDFSISIDCSTPLGYHVWLSGSDDRFNQAEKCSLLLAENLIKLCGWLAKYVLTKNKTEFF